jgi:hypothetical protein
MRRWILGMLVLAVAGTSMLPRGPAEAATTEVTLRAGVPGGEAIVLDGEPMAAGAPFERCFRFDRGDTAALADFTADHVGERIRVEIDGEVWRPTVMERLTDGALCVDFEGRSGGT